MKKSISSIKQKRCWSCKYYCGSREYKKGMWLGSNFEVDEKGRCSRGKGNGKDGATIYSWHCSYYERAGDVQSYISQEEAEKEIKRTQREAEYHQSKEYEKLKKLIQQEQNQIKQERLHLELERKRLEHERWLNSLSPEEKEKFLLKQKRKKEVDEWEKESQAKINQKLSEVQTQLNEVEKISKKAKKEKRKPFIGFTSFLVVALVCFGIGWIPYLSNIFNAEYNESLAHYWISLGNSTDHEEYLEWVSLAELFRSKANEVLYIPYLILGIFLVITIIATILLFIQRKKKLEVIEKEFNKSKNKALKLTGETEEMMKEKARIYKELIEKQKEE